MKKSKINTSMNCRRP